MSALLILAAALLAWAGWRLLDRAQERVEGVNEPGQNEVGMTVSPEMGLQWLMHAKDSIYRAFEGQGDSPTNAVATAIVGYQNALAEIERLRAERDETRTTDETTSNGDATWKRN